MRKPTYGEARAYYREVRWAAYARVREQFAKALAVPLRLTEIDARAISCWRREWTGHHPSGSGGWDWEGIARLYRRDPPAWTLALWSGDLLCGMAAGRTSERRASGKRAAVAINYVESIPPTRHPLKRQVALIATTAAAAYGELIGASHVRAVDPLPGALPLYLELGFTVVRSRGRIVYCEKEITR